MTGLGIGPGQSAVAFPQPRDCSGMSSGQGEPMDFSGLERNFLIVRRKPPEETSSFSERHFVQPGSRGQFQALPSEGSRQENETILIEEHTHRDHPQPDTPPAAKAPAATIPLVCNQWG